MLLDPPQKVIGILCKDRYFLMVFFLENHLVWVYVFSLLSLLFLLGGMHKKQIRLLYYRKLVKTPPKGSQIPTVRIA